MIPLFLLFFLPGGPLGSFPRKGSILDDNGVLIVVVILGILCRLFGQQELLDSLDGGIRIDDLAHDHGQHVQGHPETVEECQGREDRSRVQGVVGQAVGDKGQHGGKDGNAHGHGLNAITNGQEKGHGADLLLADGTHALQETRLPAEELYEADGLEDFRGQAYPLIRDSVDGEASFEETTHGLGQDGRRQEDET